MARKAYKNDDELLNTNWQDKINKASTKEEKAMYESARNDKIAHKTYQDWGGKQTQTHNFVDDDDTWTPEFNVVDEAPYHARGGAKTKEESDSIFERPRHVIYGPGVARDPVKRVQFKKNPSNANKRVRMGEYTYVFDDEGRQIGRVHDHGSSASDTISTNKAGLSVSHQSAYNAAQRGDWDEVGHWIGEIAREADPNNPDRDMTAANEYLRELQLEFPKSSQNFYRNKYDSVYGTGAWDDPNFSGSRGGDIDTRYLEQAIKNAAGNPGGLPVGPAFGVGNQTTHIGSQSGGIRRPGMGGIGGMGGGSSAEEYIRQLYAAKKDAEEARLRAMMEQQSARIKERDDLLDDIYAEKRNQAAASNDLERLRMNEMGIANGLNTGATGQLALGQSAAYQGALGQLAGQQAQDQAANDRALDELLQQYELSVNQYASQNEAQMADALYREFLRQDEIARQEAAQEAARIQAQQSLEAQASQEEWERQLAIWKLQTDLAKNGLAPAPDFGSFYGADSTPAAPVAPVAPTPAPTPRPTIDNQGYSNDVIARVQSAIGANPDGLWGPESIRKANGRTLADLVDLYGNSPAAGSPRLWANPNIPDAQKIALIESAVKTGRISESTANAYLDSMNLGV